MGRRASQACRPETFDATLALDYVDSLTVRVLHLIVPNVVSTPWENAEIHRIDLQHDDDNVAVHFSTGMLPRDCECLSPHISAVPS